MKKMLTKEQFCNLTTTPAHCWIFNGAENPTFYVDSYDNRIYFNNGVDTLWQFMRESDGSIWASHKGLGPGDMWAGWADWTDDC